MHEKLLPIKITNVDEFLWREEVPSHEEHHNSVAEKSAKQNVVQRFLSLLSAATM